ncbi:MAG: serine/threonine-protein kinase, partial [Myxococcota bacterium]
AIKMMRRERLSRGPSSTLFENEAFASLLLCHNHPGLVTVHDYFIGSEGLPYIVMELVDGGSLAELLRARAPDRLPTEVITYIALSLFDALAYAHAHGLIHCDISAANLLIARDGAIKLSDLGLARLRPDDRVAAFEERTFRGTLKYAGPEAVAGKPVDARSDLYAAGSLLYEMLSGRPPFGSGVTLTEQLRRLNHWNIPPLPAEAPPALKRLTMGLLSARPEDRRPQSAYEVCRHLRASAHSAQARQILADMVQACLRPIERARTRHADPYSLPRLPEIMTVAQVDHAPGEMTAAGSSSNISDDGQETESVVISRIVLVEDPGPGSQPRPRRLWPLLLGGALAVVLFVLYLAEPWRMVHGLNTSERERSEPWSVERHDERVPHIHIWERWIQPLGFRRASDGPERP